MEEMESDIHLLELIKKENRFAFNKLYIRYWENLYRFALSILHDEQGAKDILQDIFLTVWNRREVLEIKNPSAYLYQAVKFEVARALKKGRLTESYEHHIETLPSLNDIEEGLNLVELEHQIKITMDGLPRKCREIFYLSRFKGLPNKEIAKQLNLSQRTVEWYISNALHHLRLSINEVACVLVMLVLTVLKSY